MPRKPCFDDASLEAEILDVIELLVANNLYPATLRICAELTASQHRVRVCRNRLIATGRVVLPPHVVPQQARGRGIFNDAAPGRHLYAVQQTPAWDEQPLARYYDKHFPGSYPVESCRAITQYRRLCRRLKIRGAP